MPISKPAAHTFSCALRILWAHRIYLLIYLVVMSLMGVFVASQSIPPSTDGSMPEAPAAVAVIDRDGSAVSRGLAAYLGREAELVEVADTQRALQDAVAQESVDCLLVVPAGYGDALVEAARTGVEAPALESSLSTSGAAGLLAQIQAQGWLQAVYGFVDTLGATPEEAVELADQTTEAGAEASVAPVSEGTRTLQQRLALRVYLAFSEYPIFAAATVCIAVLMRALNQRDVRERILVAPTHAFAHSLQVFGACMLVSLVCWLWIGGLGLVLFGGELPRTDPGQVGVALLALLAYALFAGGVGFLLGQLGIGEEAANAIANIGGMVLSFLGGAWVGLDMMPPAVLDVARFTPSYWTVTASDGSTVELDSLGAALGAVWPWAAQSCGRRKGPGADGYARNARSSTATAGAILSGATPP